MKRLGVIAVLGFLVGCSDDPASRPPLNHAPRIDSLRVAGLPALPADTLGVRVHASDADGDSLTYTFLASAGDFLAAAGESAAWIAPDSARACTLSVEVSDGRASTSADTSVAILDPVPLTLTFSELFAASAGDTIRASAESDTFPLGWTLHARWIARSPATVQQIRYAWHGTSGELPGEARAFEAPIDFSGPAALSLRAIGSQGQAGRPIEFVFVGNFDPRVSFVRDAQGRRTFLAGGTSWTDGDTLPRSNRGYEITACVTASDRDGDVRGVQFLVNPRSTSTWTPVSIDTCLRLSRIGDGDYSFLARAVDGAGRIGPVDRLRFSVNQAPRFALADSASGFVQVPQPGDTLSSAEVRPLEIRFWAMDPDGSLERYRYRFDSRTWSLPVEPTPGPSRGLPAGALRATLPYMDIREGTHRVSVLATDNGGRETQTDVWFRVVR